MDDQEFNAELERLLAEEVPKVRRAEAHAEIDALLRQDEIALEEYRRTAESSFGLADLIRRRTEILRQLMEQPKDALRSHEGFMAFARARLQGVESLKEALHGEPEESCPDSEPAARAGRQSAGTASRLRTARRWLVGRVPRRTWAGSSKGKRPLASG